MPKSALSDRLNDPNNWKGTDDDNWFMRWRIPLKGLFAYGPRATEWYAKWREWPKTLFAVRSEQGCFRVETETCERDSGWDCMWDLNWLFNTDMYAYREEGEHLQFGSVIEYKQGYLSRIQYYTRWHFQIQWPFMVAFHFYFKSEDVPEYGKPRPELDGKLFYCYFGAHRDGDKVYWFPSAFAGLTWK